MVSTKKKKNVFNIDNKKKCFYSAKSAYWISEFLMQLSFAITKISQ